MLALFMRQVRGARNDRAEKETLTAQGANNLTFLGLGKQLISACVGATRILLSGDLQRRQEMAL